MENLQSPNLCSPSIAVYQSVHLVAQVRQGTPAISAFLSISIPSSVQHEFLVPWEFSHISHEIFNALAGASGLHQQPFFHASPKRSSQKNHSSPRHMEFSETLPGFELTTHEGDELLTQRKEPKAQTTVFLYGSSGHLERW